MKKNLYLALAVLGIILPYTQFVPWSNANGFDIGLMVSLMFANQIAAGVAIDALLVALSIVVLIIFDTREIRVKYWWIPIIGIFMAGISFALPFYLYLRELSKEKAQVV